MFAILLLLVAGPAQAKDKHAVNFLTGKLEQIERLLASDDLRSLGQSGRSLWDDFRDPSKDLASDEAFPGLVQRWKKVTAKAAAVAGGHATEILGDGKVPEGDDKDREQLFDDVVTACRAAAQTPNSTTARDLKNLKDNYAKYEKALARALRADPTSVRYKAGHFKLFQCEWEVAQLQMQFEDNSIHEESTHSSYQTCGYDQYVLRRLKMGGKWGAWEVDGVPGKNGYPLDCKKHPKVTKLSGNMPALVKQEFNYPAKAVWQISGQPSTAQDGLRIYQYQTIRVYANNVTVQTSACGDKDPKVVCEASGAAIVMAFNAVSHLSARAEIHRTAGRADRCKDLYKKARREAENVMRQYESESKRSDWDKTFKYKTRNDGMMSETKLIAKLTEMSDQAEERSIGKYCAKP